MVIKAPHDISNIDPTKETVFLAGSIEQGKAIDWQEEVSIRLKERYNILNPRRENWDDTWEQDIRNKEFYHQVNWELDALEEADIIILYLQGNTYSPISLLELGLFARTKKIRLTCDDQFWRKGNVDIVCERYGIQKYTCLDDIITTLNDQKLKP